MIVTKTQPTEGKFIMCWTFKQYHYAQSFEYRNGELYFFSDFGPRDDTGQNWEKNESNDALAGFASSCKMVRYIAYTKADRLEELLNG